jgi:hypothetical protein
MALLPSSQGVRAQRKPISWMRNVGLSDPRSDPGKSDVAGDSKEPPRCTR